MRSDKEIKEGLRFCGTIGCDDGCPYNTGDYKLDGSGGCSGLLLMRDALALIERLEAERPCWVDVKDALPEDDDEYMVWIAGADKPTVLYFDTTEKEFFEDTEDGCICYSVTKWAEIPRG